MEQESLYTETCAQLHRKKGEQNCLYSSKPRVKAKLRSLTTPSLLLKNARQLAVGSAGVVASVVVSAPAAVSAPVMVKQETALVSLLLQLDVEGLAILKPVDIILIRTSGAVSGGGVAAGDRVGELGEAAITGSAGTRGAISVASAPEAAADISAGKGAAKRKGKGSKK